MVDTHQSSRLPPFLLDLGLSSANMWHIEVHNHFSKAQPLLDRRDYKVHRLRRDGQHQVARNFEGSGWRGRRPCYLQAVNKFDAALAVQTEVDFTRFEAETGGYEAAYKLFESTNQDRPQNYPVVVSLDYNIWAQCQEDYKEAKERLRATTMVTH